MGQRLSGAPPVGDPYANSRPKLPHSLRDLPRFIGQIVGGFFSRLAYIVRMVWQTGHWILVMMVITAVLDGVLPIIGAILSRDILNQLQSIISERVIADVSGVPYAVTFWGSMVMLLLIFYFLYRILSQVVARISVAVTRIAGEKVVRYVRVQIMEKAKEVDLASFDRPEFYEQLENANREAGVRPISVLSSTFDVVSRAITLISYIVILATAPGMWWTALVMILVSAPTAAISFVYKRKAFQYMRRRSKDRRQMSYYSDLMVNKDMVKEIRMFDLGDRMIDSYNGVFSRYYAGMRKLIVRESSWQVLVTIISSVVNCVFFAMIAIKVFDGSLQIGDYSLYTGALTSIATTVSALINTSAHVYEGTLFIDNLMSFMKVESTVIPMTDEPIPVQHGKAHTIEFVNVSFSYPESDKKVLKNINLKFREGETVVLVGLNGAGKTTLIKLLMRLYDPTEGKILLDGRDLREYDTAELYRIFGVIFQDFGKYAFSVADNIRFGDVHRNAEEIEIREAARKANATDFIEQLSDGYDTALMRYFEPDGTELSIGQWQKLAIARAFFGDSDILILDEPTASLDPMAEQEIFNQFDQLRKDKMTIFVSHRLSSATVATKIVVLEGGEVLEEGTHRELMAQKGRYFELFSTQAKRYVEQPNE